MGFPYLLSRTYFDLGCIELYFISVQRCPVMYSENYLFNQIKNLFTLSPKNVLERYSLVACGNQIRVIICDVKNDWKQTWLIEFYASACAQLFCFICIGTEKVPPFLLIDVILFFVLLNFSLFAISHLTYYLFVLHFLLYHLVG